MLGGTACRVRILLLNNQRLPLIGGTNEEHLLYRRLRKVVEEATKLDLVTADFEAYPNYVALTVVRVEGESLDEYEARVTTTAHLLAKTVNVFLGQQDVTVSVVIRFPGEFHRLNASYDYRWPLGGGLR